MFYSSVSPSEKPHRASFRGHILQFWPLLREARQGLSPRAYSTVRPPPQGSQTGPQSEGIFYSSGPFSEKPDRASVRGHILQLWPSSEKQEWTTVPKACSTDLSPPQRIKTGPQSEGIFYSSVPLLRSKIGPQSPVHVLQFCPLLRESRQGLSPRAYSTALALFRETR